MLGLFALAFLQLGGVNDVVQAEKAFAAMAREKSVRAAFLDNIADSCILFRPGPTNGKEWWQKQADSQQVLEWDPMFAEAAYAGDLGYTTGPFLHRAKPGADPVFGHYLSIWTRSPDGRFRLVLDDGVEGPRFDGPRVLDLMPAVSTRNRPPATMKDVLDREAEYSLEFAKDPKEAFPLFASRTIRMLWPGQAPLIGMKAAMPALKPLSWTPAAGGISSSSDLAYTYGEYKGASAGHYVHIWRREGTNWKLAIELLGLPQ